MSYRPPKTTGAGSSRDVANPQYRLSRPSSSSQQSQSRIQLHQKQLPKKQNGANGGTSGFSPINRSQTTPRTAVAFAPLPNGAPAASSTTMSPNYRLQGSTASAGDGGGGAPSTTPSKKRKRRSTDQVLLDRNERLEMLDGIDGRKTRPERLPVIFTDDEDEDEEEEVEDREMEGYSDVNADAKAEGVDDDDANDEINMQFSRERNLKSPVRPYDGNDRFLQLVTSPRQKQKNKPSREQRTSGGQMPQSFIVSPETPGKLTRNAVANGGSIRPGLLSSKYGMDGSADDDDIDGEDWDTDFDQGGDDNEADEWDYNANDESPSKKAASLRRTSKSASKNKGDTTPPTKKTITSTTTTSARGRRSRNIVDNDDDKDGNYEATEKLGKKQPQLQENTSGGGGDSGFGVRPKRTCTQASPPNYTAMQVISNSPGGKLGVVGEMTKKGSFEVTRTTKQKTSRTATAATATKRGRKPNTKNPFARADRVNESGDEISKKATTTTATTTTATTKPPAMKKGKFVPEDYEKFDDEDFMEVDENEQVERDDATTTGSVIGTATLDGEEDQEEEGTISTQQSEDFIPFAEAVATTTATTTGANKKKNTTKNNNKDMNTTKATSNASITSSRRNSTITVQQPPTPATPAPLNNSPSSVHLDPKTFYPRLQSHLQHNITKYTSSYNKLINRGLTPAANIMRGKVEMAENDLEELKKRKKDLKYLAESEDLADVDEQVRCEMMKAQVKEWMKSDDWEEKV